MAITPYKQTLSHSCLAACFLMLSRKTFTEHDEQELAIDGSQRTYPFYVAGFSLEFVKKYNHTITVYADNKHLSSILEKSFTQEKRINIVHKKITQTLISELLKSQSLICHMDTHALGDYSHSSHFIILEKATEKFVTIIDPWNGNRKKITITKLIEGISDLKNQIKMCPLLFSVEV